MLDDIAISLQRAGIAFGAAVVLGIPLGLFMGQIRAVEQALDPMLQFCRQTSALAAKYKAGLAEVSASKGPY